MAKSKKESPKTKTSVKIDTVSKPVPPKPDNAKVNNGQGGQFVEIGGGLRVPASENPN